MDLDTLSGRVLLVVTGLSCQVITETLYALSRQNPATLPQHVLVLTTQEGAERTRLLLCQEGWFQKLLRDWQLPEISFGPEQILVIQDSAGTPLPDIRSPEDNIFAADAIVDTVRKLTQPQVEQLHVSIAGGRKTMGFFAGYALTLYGRPQDRLSHVLVSVDFESHPEFYYPTPYSRVIHTSPPRSKPLDTQHAVVDLAEIPFLRLQGQIEPWLRNRKVSFGEAVAETQKKLDPPRIEIDLLRRPAVLLGDTPLQLPPAECAFYIWLLARHVRGLDTACPPDGAPEPLFAQQYLTIQDRLIGELGHDRTRLRLQKGMSKDFFEQTKSRLGKSIRKAFLSPSQAVPYLPIRQHVRNRWIHTFSLAAGQIHLHNLPPQAWES
ncbi:MAG: TIGR02584 family CRISPR-associated protein [Acidithiobacillus sp.]|nr:TIGR02584 family CRISPR-associated protein [Acidithiobacillus sp.]